MATMQLDEKASDTTNQTEAPARKRSWKSVIGKIFLGLLAVVAILCIVIAMQPAEFKVVRTATMTAPPEAIFVQINDFHNWEAWSPWAKLDPNAKNTFEGPSSGEGAKLSWSGNSNVGEGSMTIVQSVPNKVVRIKLAFVRPFPGTSNVQFAIEPDGGQSKVIWSMAGENNFIAKAIGLFMDCEKMVGDEYDKGLANIKTTVESGK